MVAKEPFQIRPITQKIIFCRNHEKVIHFTKPNRKVNIHKIFSIFARRKSCATEQTIEKLIILRGCLEIWHGNVARCDNESDHVSNLKKLSVKARYLWNSLKWYLMTAQWSARKYSVAIDYPTEIPSLETCFTYASFYKCSKTKRFFRIFCIFKKHRNAEIVKTQSLTVKNCSMSRIWR